MTVVNIKDAVLLHKLPARDTFRAMFQEKPAGEKPHDSRTETYGVFTTSLHLDCTERTAARHVATQVLAILERAILIAATDIGTHQYTFRAPSPAGFRLFASRKAELVAPFCQVTLETTYDADTNTVHLAIDHLHHRMSGYVLFALQRAGYKPLPYGDKGWKVELS